MLKMAIPINEVFMRKKALFVCLSFWILELFPSLSFADEISQLKAQMKTLQNQVQAQAEEIEKLKGLVSLKEEHKFKRPAVEEVETVDVIASDDMEFVLYQQEVFNQKLVQMIQFDIYATLEFENFQRTDSVFDARNIELLGEAQFNERLKGFVEIEFERTAITSSGRRQGEVEVEQGWVEYAINDAFKPRAGVVLVPFGKFNLEHFDPFRDLVDRPIAMRRVVPVTWAEAGAGFTGFASSGENLGEFFKDWEINYQFFFVNGLTNEISDKGLRSARGSFGSDNNNNKAFVGRLGVQPLSNLEVGVSGYFGEYDKKREINGLDVDLDLTVGPFEVIGEWALFDLDGGGFQDDEDTLVVADRLRGGYIQANYHFWFDFLDETFLGRSFENPVFTAIFRYGRALIDDDGDAGGGTNKEERYTIGMNYRPVETWAIKLEYQINSTDNEVLENGDRNGFVASVSAAF